MDFFFFVIVLVGFFGVIGNQYSGLRKMEQLQQTLNEINQGIKDMNGRGPTDSHRGKE
ncbi:hypothetical protein [Paenibacillus sp. DMB20]|uniref:hypothetical protein n=1 Tax=Paenibacillus sp. DMB20 TaxID=1642570 RepID=UPI000A58A174|nr:hypothetical protein [Paenibacillus sp. DMB20]